MIDIENDVFTKVSSAVLTQFPNAKLSGEEVRSPSEFPFVSIEEADNYTYENTIDSGSNENHAVVMYEINVYSNKGAGKKAECKAIFALIDEVMLSFGFTRTMKNPIKNDTATVYRIIARYTAVVSQEKKFYRR